MKYLVGDESVEAHANEPASVTSNSALWAFCEVFHNRTCENMSEGPSRVRTLAIGITGHEEQSR